MAEAVAIPIAEFFEVMEMEIFFLMNIERLGESIGNEEIALVRQLEKCFPGNDEIRSKEEDILGRGGNEWRRSRVSREVEKCSACKGLDRRDRL